MAQALTSKTVSFANILVDSVRSITDTVERYAKRVNTSELIKPDIVAKVQIANKNVADIIQCMFDSVRSIIEVIKSNLNMSAADKFISNAELCITAVATANVDFKKLAKTGPIGAYVMIVELAKKLSDYSKSISLVQLMKSKMIVKLTCKNIVSMFKQLLGMQLKILIYQKLIKSDIFSYIGEYLGNIANKLDKTLNPFYTLTDKLAANAEKLEKNNLKKSINVLFAIANALVIQFVFMGWELLALGGGPLVFATLTHMGLVFGAMIFPMTMLTPVITMVGWLSSKFNFTAILTGVAKIRKVLFGEFMSSSMFSRRRASGTSLDDIMSSNGLLGMFAQFDESTADDISDRISNFNHVMFQVAKASLLLIPAIYAVNMFAATSMQDLALWVAKSKTGEGEAMDYLYDVLYGRLVDGNGDRRKDQNSLFGRGTGVQVSNLLKTTGILGMFSQFSTGTSKQLVQRTNNFLRIMLRVAIISKLMTPVVKLLDNFGAKSMSSIMFRLARTYVGKAVKQDFSPMGGLRATLFGSAKLGGVAGDGITLSELLKQNSVLSLFSQLNNFVAKQILARMRNFTRIMFYTAITSMLMVPTVNALARIGTIRNIVKLWLAKRVLRILLGNSEDGIFRSGVIDQLSAIDYVHISAKTLGKALLLVALTSLLNVIVFKLGIVALLALPAAATAWALVLILMGIHRVIDLLSVFKLKTLLEALENAVMLSMIMSSVIVLVTAIVGISVQSTKINFLAILAFLGILLVITVFLIPLGWAWSLVGITVVPGILMMTLCVMSLIGVAYALRQFSAAIEDLENLDDTMDKFKKSIVSLAETLRAINDIFGAKDGKRLWYTLWLKKSPSQGPMNWTELKMNLINLTASMTLLTATASMLLTFTRKMKPLVNAGEFDPNKALTDPSQPSYIRAIGAVEGVATAMLGLYRFGNTTNMLLVFAELAFMTVSVTLLIAISVELILLSKIEIKDLDAAKTNVDLIFDTARYIIESMIGDPHSDLANPQEKESAWSKFARGIGMGVGSFLLMIVAFTNVLMTFVSVTIILLIAGELALLGSLDLESVSDRALKNVDIVFDTADKIIDKLVAGVGGKGEDSSIKKNENKFVKFFKNIGSKISDIASIICSMGRLVTTFLAIGLVTTIASSLTTIAELKVNETKVSTNTDTIIRLANLVAEKVSGSSIQSIDTDKTNSWSSFCDNSVKMFKGINDLKVENVKTLTDMYTQLTEFMKSLKDLDLDQLNDQLMQIAENLAGIKDQVERNAENTTTESTPVSTTPASTTPASTSKVTTTTADGKTTVQTKDYSTLLAQISNTLETINRTAKDISENVSI